MNELYYKFIEAFNNRELAALTWMGLLAIIINFKGSVRKGLKGVLSALFQKKILAIFLSQLLYFTIIIIVANYFEIWEDYLLKDSIWYTVGSLGLTVKYISKNKKNTNFWSVIGSIVTLTVIIEFIANFYSFNYLFELILFPFMFLLGGVIAITDNDNDKAVNQFANVISGLLGLWFLGHSINLIYISIQEFLSIETLKLFLQPIILSIIYIPFIYGLLLIVEYEMLIVKMKVYSNPTKQELRSIRKVLRKECGLSLSRIKELSQQQKIFRAKNSTELRTSITEIDSIPSSFERVDNL